MPQKIEKSKLHLIFSCNLKLTKLKKFSKKLAIMEKKGYNNKSIKKSKRAGAKIPLLNLVKQGGLKLV